MLRKYDVLFAKVVRTLVFVSGGFGVFLIASDEIGDQLNARKVMDLAHTANAENLPYKVVIGEEIQSFEHISTPVSQESEDDCFIDFDVYRKTVVDLRKMDKAPLPVGLNGKQLDGYGFESSLGVPDVIEKAKVNDDAVVYLEKLELKEFGQFLAVLNSPGDGQATKIVKQTEDLVGVVGEIYSQFCL